jgi:ribonuclease VapC
VEDATVSSVNYSETLQKSARLAVQPETVDSGVDALGITVSQFGRLDARLAASFYRHGSNLSLGDRACLALARNLSSPAYTADRDWLNWASQLSVEVRVIRDSATNRINGHRARPKRPLRDTSRLPPVSTAREPPR